MNKIKLKQCPCCSCSAYLETMQVRKGWEADIHCNYCGLNFHTITFNTKEHAIENAIERWNTREPMEHIEKKLDEARFPITDLKQGVFINGIQQTDQAVLFDRAIEIIKEENQ